MAFLPFFYNNGSIFLRLSPPARLKCRFLLDFSLENHLPPPSLFKITCQLFVVHEIIFNVKLIGVVFLKPSSIKLKRNESAKLQNTVKVGFLLICGWVLKLKKYSLLYKLEMHYMLCKFLFCSHSVVPINGLLTTLEFKMFIWNMFTISR